MRALAKFRNKHAVKHHKKIIAAAASKEDLRNKDDNFFHYLPKEEEYYNRHLAWVDLWLDIERPKALRNDREHELTERLTNTRDLAIDEMTTDLFRRVDLANNISRANVGKDWHCLRCTFRCTAYIFYKHKRREDAYAAHILVFEKTAHVSQDDSPILAPVGIPAGDERVRICYKILEFRLQLQVLLLCRQILRSPHIS
jgi:hypothetical protein